MITTNTLALFRADFEDTSAIAGKGVPKPTWEMLRKLNDRGQRDIMTNRVSGFGYASVVDEGDPNPEQIQLALPRMTLSQKRRGFKYKHTIEAAKFDPNGQVAIRAREMGTAFEATKEKDAADFWLNNAFDANHPISTGRPLYANNHTVGDIVAFSNLAPAATLSWSTLESMLTRLGRQKDPRNRTMGYRKKMYLLVPPELEFAAATLAESSLRPSVADNDKNVIKDRFMPVVCDEAVSGTAFALIPVDKDKHGGCKVVNTEAERGFDTDEDKFAKFAIFGLWDIGGEHPFNIIGNPGA